MNILVVEDEPKIARILVDYLQREGYEVVTLDEGSMAVEHVRTHAPDFLILDLMLPGKDGLTICREVRQFSKIPIMMLTAKVDEIDRLLGLELGADDFVRKPFGKHELLARVRGRRGEGRRGGRRGEGRGQRGDGEERGERRVWREAFGECCDVGTAYGEMVEMEGPRDGKAMR